LALLIVLLINPATVLSESFWLSFGTIALILYGMHHRLSPSGLWWKYMRVQWVIGIGLIPLTFALFGECSLISFVANTIAIPWLAVSILPLCLASIVFIFIFPTVASGLLWLADGSLALLWSVLSTLAQTSWSSLHIYIPDIYYLLGMMMGVVLLLLPAGMPLRILGVIGFLPVFLHQGDKPARNEYWLNLLDVGQGLSVVVQTANHILVYDAGAKVTASSDMGERIVLPYLRSMGAKKIDLMVISHADNDHIGGAKSILQNYPGTLIKTSVPEKFNKAHYCQYGDSWQWDGVKFTFLYPSQHEKNLRNDSSCVLQIDNGKYKTLLTGDIEKFAEHELVNNIPDQLAADILVAPHHGSKTSAVPAFVAAVHPQMVLYATGYLNRYHFPHAKVVQAYEAIHALAFNTVDTGSVRFKVGNDVMSDAYRVKGRRYWMD
jgi:competence protein ComEC